MQIYVFFMQHKSGKFDNSASGDGAMSALAQRGENMVPRCESKLIFAKELFDGYHIAFVTAWSNEPPADGKLSLHALYFKLLRSKLATYHKQSAGTPLEVKPRSTRVPKPKETAEEARARLEAECMLEEKDEVQEDEVDVEQGKEETAQDDDTVVSEPADELEEHGTQEEREQLPDEDTDGEEDDPNASPLGTAVSRQSSSSLSSAPSTQDDVDIFSATDNAVVTKAGETQVEEKEEEENEEEEDGEEQGAKETLTKKLAPRPRKKPISAKTRAKTRRGAT